MNWFESLRSLVNSTPPCNLIDCFPDFLEPIIAAVLNALEAIFSSLFGVAL